MNFLELVQNAVQAILSKKNQRKAVESVSRYLQENGLSPNYSKDVLTRDLNRIIHGEGPDEHRRTLDMLFFQKSEPLRLTQPQKNNLIRIRDMIAEAPVPNTCTHKNLALTGSLHGGGFTPLLPYPEIICRDCGVNVTLYTMNVKLILDEYGVSLTKKNAAELKEWLGFDKEYMGRKRFAFGEDVLKDPQRVLSECELWKGELPFQIADLEKFTARSGK